MTKGNIALSNTINISLQKTPSGLGEFNTNNIYLFTNEKPLSVKPYIWAISADDIINEYGTNSKTAQIGTALFTPSQNLRGGRGQVLVFPYNATDATSATLTTEALTEDDIINFQQVTNGTFTIVIDGTTYNPVDLDFSAVNTVADIVTVLNNIGLDCNISVVNNNQIQFQSRRYGKDGSIILKETNEIDLYGADYLGIATAQTGAGVEATSGYTTTEPLTENLGNFTSVSDGVLTLSIDGQNKTITGLDFQEASTAELIMGVIQAKLEDVTLSIEETNKIKFTNNTTGATSKIELAKTTEPSGTDIYGVDYLDGETQYIMYGANATSAYITTPEITVENFQSVAKGTFTITIDGEETQPENLNFTKVKDINDVVSVLNGAGLKCGIAVVEANKIQFTSPTAGTQGSISITATQLETNGTDIYEAPYLKGASAVSVEGVNSTGTTLQEALLQAQEVSYCGGIVTTQLCDNATVVANATYIQTTDHVYYEVTQSLDNIETLGAQIQSASLTKTRLFAYSSNGAIGAKQALASYATVAQSVNYSGSNTVLTMNLKELAGITPDTNLNQTYFNLAKQYGVDIYASTEGLSCVYSFDNGYYTDEATTDLWLKKNLEVNGFNYLRQTNTKIPQTEQGMTGLKSAYEQSCIAGVRNGSFAPGTWNGSIPFGNPEDFLRNIKEQGYYIYSLPIAQQAQAEREDRIASVVQIALKRAGAIHSSDVIVNIQR